MASIRKEISIAAPPGAVWDAVRDFGAPHERLVPGVLSDARLDGEGARVVTFAAGLVVRERLVDVDEAARRLVYTVVDGFATHHNASMQVLADGAEGSLLVWIADVLPHELAASMGALMEQGAQAMARALARAA